MSALLCRLSLLLCITNTIHSLSTSTSSVKTFHIGAGCFWEPADKLRNVNGIISTTVGYCGDDKLFDSNPSYDYVCSGRTKLVEAVRVEYDPAELSYTDMLSLFSEVNTAQYRNKRQYQGVIFTSSDQQAKEAEKFLANDKLVVATVEPMSSAFYTAEGYHQNYWLKWKTRAVVTVATLVFLGYFEDALGIPQQVWNYLCYGLIGFTLLERKIDSKREKIIVDKLVD